MPSGKAQVQDVRSHAAGHQKQIRTSNTWISTNEVLRSWLINTVYYLLVKNNEEEGRGAKKGGGIINFIPLKRGGLFERGGFIENLRNKFQIPVIYCNEAFSVIKELF